MERERIEITSDKSLKLKEKATKRAKQLGFDSLGAYVRNLIINDLNTMKNLILITFLFLSTIASAQVLRTGVEIDQTGYQTTYISGDSLEVWFKIIGAYDTQKDYVRIQYLAEDGNGGYKYFLVGNITLKDHYRGGERVGYGFSFKFKLEKGMTRIVMDPGKTPLFAVSAPSGIMTEFELTQKEGNVKIYSLTGEFIKEASITSYKESLPYGVYLFTYADKNSFFSGKIICN